MIYPPYIYHLNLIIINQIFIIHFQIIMFTNFLKLSINQFISLLAFLQLDFFIRFFINITKLFILIINFIFKIFFFHFLLFEFLILIKIIFMILILMFIIKNRLMDFIIMYHLILIVFMILILLFSHYFKLNDLKYWFLEKQFPVHLKFLF